MGFDRLKRDVRRSHYMENNPPEEKNDGEEKEPYVALFHIKSEWEPEGCDSEKIEEALEKFEKQVKQVRKRYTAKPTVSNLLPSQYQTIKQLQNNDDVIVIQADKNLGGVTMLREEYCRRVVSEHLSNTDVYQRLDATTAGRKKDVIASKVRAFVHKYSNDDEKSITDNERYWLMEQTNKLHQAPLPRFRGTLKVHKKTPKLRPIVCCAGSLLNCLSVWTSYQLKKLLHLCPSYLKDSNHLLHKLKKLGKLPPGARLFCADAKSMYTNINCEHAIDVISTWFERLEYRRDNQKPNGMPPGFPTEAVLEALKIVMKNNLFQWGDCFFLQLDGTAMGTSSACDWATIYYAVHENETLLSIYEEELIEYSRYIDDMFGIFLPDPTSEYTYQQQFDEVVKDMPFGDLEWEDIEFGKRVHFLDLWISIDSNNNLITETYQKEMNLYQYIPPTSAHPPHMMKGIVFSLMRNYYLQNTLAETYINIASLLHKRLVARGWDKKVIKEYILAADEKLRLNPPTLYTPPPDPDDHDNGEFKRTSWFLPWAYHPNDVPRHVIQKIFQQECADILEEELGCNKLTIMYSKAPNLQEKLTKAKLHEPRGKEASTYFAGGSPTTS